MTDLGQLRDLAQRQRRHFTEYAEKLNGNWEPVVSAATLEVLTVLAERLESFGAGLREVPDADLARELLRRGWTKELMFKVTDPNTERHVDCLVPPSRAATPTPQRPRVVCLCGSTRFHKAFQRANYEETMAGRIVLSVGFAFESESHGEDVGCTPEQKLALDALHKRKIDLADEILVLNVDRYIGESTRAEIEYAKQRGKRVRWLEPPGEVEGLCTRS